jgi:hypothetical protein
MAATGETEWILLNMRESFEEDEFIPTQELLDSAAIAGMTLEESYRRRRYMLRFDRRMTSQVSVAGIMTPAYGIGFQYDSLSDIEAYAGNQPNYVSTTDIVGKPELVDSTREYDNDNGHDMIHVVESWEVRSPVVQFFVKGKWSSDYNEETEEIV